MREIKFRAWDGEAMIYKIVPSPFFPGIDNINRLDVVRESPCSEYCNQVDILKGVEAIEQYTGLKDKNGEEIYEGDIISNHNGKLATVFYDEASSAYRFKWLDVPVSDFLYWFNVDRVIGNIHENPELLKEKK